MMWKHGTQYGYRIKKCRCDECKQWNTETHNAYMQRRYAKGFKRKIEPDGSTIWVTVCDSQSLSPSYSPQA